jgi:hypothetical protein
MAEEKALSKRNKATVPEAAMLEFFGAMKHILTSRPLNKYGVLPRRRYFRCSGQ